MEAKAVVGTMKKAQDIANELESTYQEKAFELAVMLLMEKPPSYRPHDILNQQEHNNYSANRPTPQNSSSNQETSTTFDKTQPNVSPQNLTPEEIQRKLEEAPIDYAPFLHILKNGSAIQKTLVALTVARDQLGIPELNAHEIAILVKGRFRVSKYHANNISRDFKNKPNYADRIRKKDRGYCYRLLLDGDHFLQQLLNED